MTQNQWYAILSCTDLKKKLKENTLKHLNFSQICNNSQLEKPRYSALIVPEVCASQISFLQGSKDYYNIQITEQRKLIGLINIQVNDDTVNTFH